MNLDVLKEFVSLAEKKSFRETADQFGISSSAVTKHITALENELGVSLFERTTRKVTLGIYGQTFLPYAQQILKTLETSQIVLSNLQKHNNSTLTIGMSYIDLSFLSDVLKQFKLKFPDCNVDFIQSAAPDTLELMLKNRFCDLAFMRKDPDNPMFDKEISYSIYQKEQLAAYIPAIHPLAKNTAVSIHDLKMENLIFYSPHSQVHEISVKLCNDAGFEPNIVMTNNSRLSCQYMAQHNVGIALLPLRLTGDGPLISGVKTALIEPPCYINIYVAFIRSNLLLNSMALEFLQCLNLEL